MSSTKESDFQSCLSVQPKHKSLPPSTTAKQLAEELLILVNNDANKAVAIVMELLHYYPHKSIAWCYEQAVSRLSLSGDRC